MATTRKRNWVIAGILLVVVSAGIIWWQSSGSGLDPEVARIKELQREAFSGMVKSGKPTEDQVQKLIALKEEEAKLTETQRKSLGQERGMAMQKLMTKDAKDYLALSEEAKIKFLDDKIDQMEAFMTMGKAFGGFFGKGPRGPNGGAGGSKAASDTVVSTGSSGTAQGNAANGTTATAQNANAAAPGNASPKGPSNEDIQNWAKNRLNNSTPEARAQMNIYMKDMQARRADRGLPNGFGPPR